MFSPQHIAKGTAIALTLGAIAAPAASAGPIQDQLAAQPRHTHVAGSVPVAASKLVYARQDKQLAPSSPVQTPTIASPVVPRATSPTGSFDWGDAGIGAAGGLVISILGVGGAFALSQRRTRRTGTSVIATG